MKVGQFSLKALKISNANNLSPLTSIVHNLKNNHLVKNLILVFVFFQF